MSEVVLIAALTAAVVLVIYLRHRDPQRKDRRRARRIHVRDSWERW